MIEGLLGCFELSSLSLLEKSVDDLIVGTEPLDEESLREDELHRVFSWRGST